MIPVASSCSRKIGYNTRAVARMAIKGMARKGKATNSMSVYRCTFCAYFHIGNKDKKKKHA